MPLDTATACEAPTAAASSFSKAATSGPWITQRERTTRATASASVLPSWGRVMGTRTLLALGGAAKWFLVVG